jgi:hypothetical protein
MRFGTASCVSVLEPWRPGCQTVLTLTPQKTITRLYPGQTAERISTEQIPKVQRVDDGKQWPMARTNDDIKRCRRRRRFAETNEFPRGPDRKLRVDSEAVKQSPASGGTSENGEREDDCRSDSMEGVGEAIGRSDRRSQPFRRREGLFHGLSAVDTQEWAGRPAGCRPRPRRSLAGEA